MKNMSIRVRVTLVILLLLAVAGVGVLWAIESMHEATVDQLASQSVSAARSGFDNLQQQDVDKLSAALDVLLTRDDLRDAYIAGDREGLQAMSQPLYQDLKERFGITHWYYETTEDAPSVFLRVHRPEQFGDELKRKTYLGAVEAQDYFGGLELGKTAFALRVVHPYYAEDGTLVGYLELGEEIDHFFEVMKAQSGDDVALVLLKDRLSAEDWAVMRVNQGKEDDWNADENIVLANSTSEAIVVSDLAVPVEELDEEGSVFEQKTEGGRTYVRGAFPVTDAAGERVGAVIVQQDVTDVVSELQQTRTVGLLVLVAVGIAIIAVVLMTLNSLVFKRLNGMISSMEGISLRLMGGEFNVSAAAPDRHDEIGKFEEFFGNFVSVVAKTLETLSKR